MKYAIVESGGKQYKAVEGGTLEVDRLPQEPGAKVKLEKVLLFADEGNITVGAPTIKNNPVWTKVIEHFKGDKVIIFNYSPKKRIRVKTGHRQNYTRLLVEQVGGSEFIVKKAAPKAVEAEKGEEKKEKAKATVEKAAPAPVKKAEPKAASPKTKAAPRKTVAKPTPAKVDKAAKTAAKPAKPAAKKPASSAKKSAEKK